MKAFGKTNYVSYGFWNTADFEKQHGENEHCPPPKVLRTVKGFCTSGEEEHQGGPPWSSDHDHLDEALSWRVFGVIQNPSGFGVFRLMSHPGFKGFVWNFLISEKYLFKVENVVENFTFLLEFARKLRYTLSSPLVQNPLNSNMLPEI